MGSKSFTGQRVFVMGLAILCIMLFHQRFVSAYALLPFKLFGHWGVDLFFYISGVGITYSLKKNSLGMYLCNRMVRIVPPYLLVSIPYCLVYAYLDRNTWLDNFPADLWFIRAIIIFYVIAPLVMVALNRWGTKAFWVTYAGIALLGIPVYLWPDLPASMGFSPYYVSLAMPRVPAFILGMACVLYPDWGDKMCTSRRARWVGGFCLTVSIFLSLLWRYSADIPWYHPEYNDFCLYMEFIFLLPVVPIAYRALDCCGGFLAGSGRKLHACFVFLGTISLEIYLWHELVCKRSTKTLVVGHGIMEVYELIIIQRRESAPL